MVKANTLPRLARYVLRPGALDEYVRRGLERLPSDSPGDTAAGLAELVRRGDAKVCTIHVDEHRSGFVVFMISEVHELVILGAFGRDTAENLVEILIGRPALLDSLARACECTTIRFHTMRPGLIRQAEARGFHVSEVVMRRDVR